MGRAVALDASSPHGTGGTVDRAGSLKKRFLRRLSFCRRPVGWAMMIALLCLTGCAYTRPIYFKNPSNGLTVVCGPFTHRDVQQGKEKLCIQKAADEGYIRVAN